jgi:hypothetical protein
VLCPFEHVVEFTQQPLHELALHTHTPPELQARPLPHAWQLTPPTPHVEALEVRHWPFESQHPLGHELALHTHAPPELHVRPLPHAWQLAPPLPQVASPEFWHCPFASQQPLGHVVPSHTHLPCVEHRWLAPHAVHCTPPTPHVELPEVWHFPAEQQPVHEVSPQLQAPFVHAWPDEHDPHALPADPHVAVDCEAIRTHLLVASQQPPGHELGVQVHAPIEQACPVEHAPQAAPRVPHFAFAWLAKGTHVLPSQHPFGQVTASHAGAASLPLSPGGVVMSTRASARGGASTAVSSPIETSVPASFVALASVEASYRASGVAPPRPPVPISLRASVAPLPPVLLPESAPSSGWSGRSSTVQRVVATQRRAKASFDAKCFMVPSAP